MAAAVAACEQAAASKLQCLSQEHAAAQAAQAAAQAAAEQEWRQRLSAAQAAHEQELSGARSAATTVQQSTVAGLVAKHEAAVARLAQQIMTAEQAASLQASLVHTHTLQLVPGHAPALVLDVLRYLRLC